MTTIKRGDTRPLVYRANADLSAATLRFLVREQPNQGPVTTIVPSSVTVDAGVSTVTVPVTTINTDLSPSNGWLVELEATQAGVVQTFPSETFERLRVIADLG